MDTGRAASKVEQMAVHSEDARAALTDASMEKMRAVMKVVPMENKKAVAMGSM